MRTSNQKLQARNHESYGAFTALAILIPPIAIVVGIIYLAKNSQLDRKLGEHTIAVAIFSAIIISILWYIFAPHQYTPAGTMVPTVTAPVRNIDTAYERVVEGMTKTEAEAVVERAPQNCGESSGFESCSYGAVTTDNGIIVINYANGVVNSKSKAYF